MKIIYASQFNLSSLPAAVPLLVSESKTFNHNYSATGFSLIGCTGSVTVEASDDNFSTTVYSSVQTGSVVVDLAGTVTAEKWRVTANAGGATLQYLYVGQLIDVQVPSYPHIFEQRILADDRQSLAGVKFSKVYAKPRAGTWVFKNVVATELPNWQNWFNETNGFRKAFAVELPLLNESAMITATAQAFPLVYQRPNYLSGSLAVQELL